MVLPSGSLQLTTTLQCHVHERARVPESGDAYLWYRGWYLCRSRAVEGGAPGKIRGRGPTAKPVALRLIWRDSVAA